ncbi:MAG: hypothetical protein R3321_13305, partial [Nitrososphaeraceae archaeon]|nr:hypothetical protein [Nitrososphaeraceae archaeon]
QEGTYQLDLKTDELSGFWIIETGALQVSFNGIDFIEYGKRDIIEINSISRKSNNIFIRVDNPVRVLVIERIILLNILKNSHNIIWNSLQEIADFSSNLKFENYPKQKVA